MAYDFTTAVSWTDALEGWLENRINDERCFSSGEFSSECREIRPDFVFSQRRVGEAIRDRVGTSACSCYASTGDYPVQVTRVTQGLARTPAGVEVIVYGPTTSDADVYDFEVPIPFMGSPASLSAQAVTLVQFAPSPTSQLSLPYTTLKVAADGRLYLPKLLVDKFAKGHDEVYVEDDVTASMLVSADHSGFTMFKTYKVWNTGRVAFYGTSHPLTPGDEYKATLNGTILVVEEV